MSEDGGTTQLQNAAVTWGTSFPFVKNFTGTVDIKKVIALRAVLQSGSRLVNGDWVPVSDPQTTPGLSVSVASIGRDGSGNLTWDVTATTDDVQGAGQICPSSSGCWLYLYAQFENGYSVQLQNAAVTWGTTFPFARQFVGSLNTGRIVAVRSTVQGTAGQFSTNWVTVSDPKPVPSGSGSVAAGVNSIGRNASGALTYDITATVTGATATDGPCGNVSSACSVNVQAKTTSGEITTLKSASIPLLATSSTTLAGTAASPEIVAIRAHTSSGYAPKWFYSSWVSVADPYPTREVSAVGATVSRNASGGLAWELAVSVSGASQSDGPCGGSSYNCRINVQARNALGDILNLKAVDLSATLSYTGTITGTTSLMKEITDLRFYTSAQYAPRRFFSSWVAVSDPYPPRAVTITAASTKRDIPTGKLAYGVSVNVTGASLADGPCGGNSYYCFIYLQALTADGDINTFRTEDLLAVGTFTNSYTGLTTQKKVVAIRAYTSGYHAPNRFYSEWLYFDDPARSESVGGGNAAKKDCVCSNADPVNSETGEFYETETDLSMAGVGPAVAVSRTYSSFGTSVGGPFGFGWTSDFEASLVIDKAGDPGEPLPRLVHVVQENGATVPFTRAEDGSYPASPWVLASLTHEEGEGTWTFTRKNKEIVVFDSNGRLITRSDLHGNTVEYAYSSGRVTSIQGSGGRELNLTWTSGRVTKITDSASREVTYTYDASGNLIAFEDAAGAVWEYTYDSSHRLLTQSSPEGGTTTNVYNASSQVTSQTDPVGRVTTFAYSDLSTLVTLPDGSITAYAWDEGRPRSITTASGTPLAATTTLAYDDEGNRVASTDPLGKVTTSTFDANGNELTTTDPLNRTTTRTFDSDGNVLTVEDPIGRTTTMTYNAGDLVSLTSPGGHEQTWTRNADGTVASHTDAREKETTFTYDSAGRELCANNPDNRESCVEYDARGFVAVSTAAGGAETTFTYDDLGLTLTVTDPVGAVTTMTFDDNGNPLAVEDPDGKVSTFAYDDANQLTSSSNPLGKVTTYTYSSRGEVATVTNPNDDAVTTTYDAQNRVATVTDGESRTTTYGYDLAGQLLTTTLPSTAVTSTTYDDAGQVTTTTDALGKITSYEYDDASQLVSVTDPLNRTTESTYTDDGLVNIVTYPDASTEVHEYNANGQESSFTNGDGAESAYTYDDAGLLVSKTEPGGLATTYAYDAVGLLDEVTTPNGHTSSRVYDDAGALLEIDYFGSADDVAFTYDDVGRRVTMDDATGTTSYSYTDAGQMASVQDGNGGILAYEYDDAGQLTTVTYPGNRDVDYTYDSAGQMTSVSGWATGVTEYAYTPDGYLHTREDPNGVTETRSYDANGQLTSIIDQTSSVVIAEYAYAYDDAGQLITTTMTDPLHVGAAQNWGYDPLGQLTTSSSPSGAFAATPAGLLTNTSDGDELTYDSAGQLENLANTSTGVDFDFSYDGNGNRSDQVEDYAAGPDHIVDYDYNEADNLTGWDDGTHDIDYIVDGDGLRQTRIDNTSATSFLWDANAALPLLLDDGVHTFIYGPGLTPIAQTDGTDTEYLYADNIGTVRTITDDTATSMALHIKIANLHIPVE